MVSIVAEPVTRSMRAWERARSIRSQVPSATSWWARASIAAHARAASSRRKGAFPLVDARFLRPPPQGAALARPLRAPTDQVGTDPGQHGAAPPAQLRRGVGDEVLAEGGDHRGGDLRRRLLELLGHDTSPVGVEVTAAHRVMKTPEPGLGLRSGRTVGGHPDRGPNPMLGVHRRDRQGPGHDRRCIQRDVPGRSVSLDLAAVLELRRLDRGQRRDCVVLHRAGGVDHPLRRGDDRRPLRPRATGPRRRRHRDQAGLGGRKDLEQLTGRPNPTLRLRRLELHHCPLSLTRNSRGDHRQTPQTANGTTVPQRFSLPRITPGPRSFAPLRACHGAATSELVRSEEPRSAMWLRWRAWRVTQRQRRWCWPASCWSPRRCSPAA